MSLGQYSKDEMNRSQVARKKVRIERMVTRHSEYPGTNVILATPSLTQVGKTRRKDKDDQQVPKIASSYLHPPLGWNIEVVEINKAFF